MIAFIVKLWKVLRLCVYVLWKLIEANMRVAHDVITPSHHMKPGVVLIPLDIKNEFQIFILANVITLTPGSITLGVTNDKAHLIVHGMFIDNISKFKKEIKDDFESKIIEVFEK